MTIDDIKALIAPDESRTLELKKTTGELKDGMHAACAFLNTDGGWLIFGIAPKSLKIIGQQVTDATKIEISQALAGIEPAYDIQPIYIDVPEYPGNKVIANGRKLTSQSVSQSMMTAWRSPTRESFHQR